jgi:hypothetical protein
MKVLIASLLVLAIGSEGSRVDRLAPFKAECQEGETHRFDGGNGLDIGGNPIADPLKGWSTEKWGGLQVTWLGGKNARVGNADAQVVGTTDATLSVVWTHMEPLGSNIYSMVLDTILGEAVYSQVHASATGPSRQIKARVQNLRCTIVLQK